MYKIKNIYTCIYVQWMTCRKEKTMENKRNMNKVHIEFTGARPDKIHLDLCGSLPLSLVIPRDLDIWIPIIPFLSTLLYFSKPKRWFTWLTEGWQIISSCLRRLYRILLFFFFSSWPVVYMYMYIYLILQTNITLKDDPGVYIKWVKEGDVDPTLKYRF